MLRLLTKSWQSVNPIQSTKKCFRTLSNHNKLDLSGIYPPIATPFKENEDIDFERLSANIEKWNDCKFAGYVVQGSNGEYVSLSISERVEMVGFVAQNIGKEKQVIAGSGCEGTKETIELTSQMAEAGAHASLVVTPSFFKSRMTSPAFIQHYKMVADNSPIPIILYNVPSNTGVELPVDAIIELSNHPNIIGLKDSSGNITNLGHIINKTSQQDFQVLAGSASILYSAINLGAVGGICALANVLGEECCELYDLIKTNNLEMALELQLQLIEPNQAVTRKYNVPALKFAMELFGFFGGRCRSPLTPLTSFEKEDIRKSFHKFL